MYTCAFCHTDCYSLSAHWERCPAYKQFMAGKRKYYATGRNQCATPNCTNKRVPRRHKCAACIARELEFQKHQTYGNGWSRK